MLLLEVERLLGDAVVVVLQLPLRVREKLVGRGQLNKPHQQIHLLSFIGASSDADPDPWIWICIKIV